MVVVLLGVNLVSTFWVKINSHWDYPEVIKLTVKDLWTLFSKNTIVLAHEKYCQITVIVWKIRKLYESNFAQFAFLLVVKTTLGF